MFLPILAMFIGSFANANQTLNVNDVILDKMLLQGKVITVIGRYEHIDTIPQLYNKGSDIGSPSFTVDTSNLSRNWRKWLMTNCVVNYVDKFGCDVTFTGVLEIDMLDFITFKAQSAQ